MEKRLTSVLNGRFLTKSQLIGFQKYKYSSVDTNPVGLYVMHPFWNVCIKLFPVTLAPNLITFSGFLFIIKSFLLLSFYDYSFYASSDQKPDVNPVPSWVYALVALNIFTSYSLDGLDGKQARRTGTSGPLGELFDHGLDSWTTVFIPVLLYSLFGRLDYSLPPYRIFLVCCLVYINFYLSHVEKYNTGVLYLPWSYDFSMLGSVVVFGMTSVLGYRFWKGYIFGISVAQFMEVMFYLSTVFFNIPMVLRWSKSIKDGTNKYTLQEGLKPLISLIIFLALEIIWLFYSPTNLVERDPRIFCLLSGSIFSNICCRLIISQMSNTKCQMFNVLLVPLFFVVSASILMPSLELVILYLSCFCFTLYHIYFGICCVEEMCEHFKISCFDISYAKKR